jgi:hypothetical protein
MIELPDHPPHGTGRTAQLYEEVRSVAEEPRKMTREEALSIVLDAAGYWADELVEWIAPASDQFDDAESAEAERSQADDIWEAIAMLRGRDA